MYLAHDVAGWSLHSADRLRKLTKEKGKNPKKRKSQNKKLSETPITTVSTKLSVKESTDGV